MSVTDIKDRITIRMPQAIAEKLQEAADLTGATTNQFMVQAALEKAEKIIDGEKNIYFSKNDAAMLIHMLDHPSGPTAALKRAFERLKQKEIDDGNQSDADGSSARS